MARLYVTCADYNGLGKLNRTGHLWPHEPDGATLSSMTSRWWFYPALIAVSLVLVAAGVGALTVVLLWPKPPQPRRPHRLSAEDSAAHL
jgi:hypothetical protein